MITLKSLSFMLFGMHAASKLPPASPRQPADASPPRDYAPEPPQTVDDRDQEAYFISISRGM
jgi:hypothetical protein